MGKNTKSLVGFVDFMASSQPAHHPKTIPEYS